MELSSNNNKNTVLVTGASGFIGLNTVKAFLKKGFNVTAMIHNHKPKELELLGNTINFVYADIDNEKSVTKAIENMSFDFVVHVAGIAKDIGKDDLYRKVNFEPIKYLSKIPKKKFIYISSTDVYGMKDFSGETEDELPFETKPINPYPKYKIESEKWLIENISKDKYVIIRPAAVYGDNDKTLEKRFVDFLKISPFIIHFGKNKGKNRWPLANVKNAAKCIVAGCITDVFNGKAINIIDDKYTTMDEYYRIVAKKYFPNKKYITISLPFYLGKVIGYISTTLSNFLSLKNPIYEPTLYALYSVSSNLDFSSDRMQQAVEIYDEYEFSQQNTAYETNINN